MNGTKSVIQNLNILTITMFSDIYSSVNGKSSHAIVSLQRRFLHECKRFESNQKQMDKLAKAYFSYRDLLHQQEESRARILKIFGTLGVLSPDDAVSKKLLEQVSSTPISSLDIRNFLIDVRLSSITAQAINSAIKTHPELFEEKDEGKGRVVMLRKPKAIKDKRRGSE
jgi:hypothetical protein